MDIARAQTGPERAADRAPEVIYFFPPQTSGVFKLTARVVEPFRPFFDELSRGSASTCHSRNFISALWDHLRATHGQGRGRAGEYAHTS